MRCTVVPSSKVTLNSFPCSVVKVNHSTTAIAQNGALIYPSTPNINIDISQKQQPEIVEKNTLTTEQGNEFRVTFEDGTTVHLNYNTEIRYPVKFSKTKRTVYLKGEAYFKIAKDARPFYVVTDQGIILILPFTNATSVRPEVNVLTLNSVPYCLIIPWSVTT